MKRLFYVTLLFTFASCKHENSIHPHKKEIVETVYASGKIIADSEYSVFALSPGAIVKKLVKEGDVVKKGQVLFIIQHDAQESKLAAVQSSLELAQSNLSGSSRVLADLKLAVENAQTKLTNDSLQYIRLKNLWNENIGTQSNVDNAYSAYQVSRNQKRSAQEKYQATVNDLNVSLQNARSQTTSAQSDLNNYFIRSESNGTVYQTFKEAGEAVKMNEAVALLGKTSKRVIKLAIDQQDVDKVKPGQEVLLKTDVTGGIIYHATIIRIYPAMNETDQTFRADALFTDDVTQSYIHSSVEANIIIQTKKNALVVPGKAFTTGDSLQVKQDGKVKTIAVKTGIHTLDDVEVISGIDESALIILPTQK